MWNSWPTAATSAAPPLPPPSTAAAQPPAPLIGPTLPQTSTTTTTAASAIAIAAPPVHTVAPVHAIAPVVPAGVGTNPYAQYTAAQYAAMTPEQQYAIQQHWQQWQAYEQQYAQWHAQYGEQYKREMQAMAVAPAAPVASYTATLPPMSYPPPIVPIPAPPPTVAYQTQPPPPIPSEPQITTVPPIVAGLAHIYQQPPPPPPPPQESAQSMSVPPPPISGPPPSATAQYQAQYPPPQVPYSQQHQNMYSQQQPPPNYQQNYPQNPNQPNNSNQNKSASSESKNNTDFYQQEQNFGKNSNQNQNRSQGNRQNNRNQQFGRNHENFQSKDYENQNNNNNQGFGNKPNWRGNQRGRGNGRFSDGAANNNDSGNYSDDGPNRDRSRYSDINRSRNNSFEGSSWGNSGLKNYDNSQNLQSHNWNQQQNNDMGNNRTPTVQPKRSIQDLDEKLFDEQFRQWEEQFENWKKENANHPDKAMYMQYEREFEKARRRIMERREQMRRRKAQQSHGTDSQQNQQQQQQQQDNRSCDQQDEQQKISQQQEDKSNQKPLDEHNQGQDITEVQQDVVKQRVTESESDKTSVTNEQKLIEEQGNEEGNNNTQVVPLSDVAPECGTSQLDTQEVSRPIATGKRKSRFEPKTNISDVVVIDNPTQAVPMTELFKKSEGIPGLDLVLSKDDQENSSNAVNSEVIDLEHDSGPTRPPKMQSNIEQDANSKFMPQIQPSVSESQSVTKKIPSLLDIVVNRPFDDDSGEGENQRVPSPISQASEKVIPQSPMQGSCKSANQRPSRTVSPAMSCHSATSNTNNPDLARVLQNPNFVQVLSAAIAQIQGSNVPANVAPDQLLQTLAPLLQQNFGSNQQQNISNLQQMFSNRQLNDISQQWGKGNEAMPLSPVNINVNNPFRRNDRGSNSSRDGFGNNSFGPENMDRFGEFGGFNRGPGFDGNDRGPGFGGNDRGGMGFGGNDYGMRFGGNDRHMGFGDNDRRMGFGGNDCGGMGFDSNNQGLGYGMNDRGLGNFSNDGRFGFGRNDRDFGFGDNDRGGRFGDNERNFGFGGNNRVNRFGGNERDVRFGPNFGGDFGSNNNLNDFRKNYGAPIDSFNSPFGNNFDGPGMENRPFGDNSNKFGPRGLSDFDRFDGNNGRLPPSSGNVSKSSIRGDDFFRPTQVIDYQNRSNPAKIVDYGHRPSGVANVASGFEKEFVPMKTFDYGHASNSNSPAPISGGTGNKKLQNAKKQKQQMQQKQQQQQKLQVGLNPEEQQLEETYQGIPKEDQNENEENLYPKCKWILLNPECRNRPGRPTKRGPRIPLNPRKIPSNKQEKEENENDNGEQEKEQQTEYDEMSNADENDGLENFDDISSMTREKSESPPPPPSFHMTTVNFDDSRTEQNSSGKNSNSSKSIFPSTASANEKNDSSKSLNVVTTAASPGNNVQMVFPSAENRNTIPIDEILLKPGRLSRPKKIVIILRGPPGSGKSHVAKLIKDKEIEIGGSSPRLLSIDDYFMIENDYEEKCEKTGRKIPKKEILYEYEKGMEEKYMQYLIKSFKKTIADNLYDFIIVDCVNSSLRTLNEFYIHAKEANFTPYIVDLLCSLETCLRQNQHERSESDIREIIRNWNETPFHYIKVDVSSLLENVIEMEDVSDMEEIRDDDEAVQEDDSNEASENADESIKKSKWENDTTSENLARLDGINKPLSKKSTQTIEDYLQIDGWEPTKYSANGKKRVRWADIEEKREQEKMRAIGFVVGQTDWNRMMDPSGGSSALTKTKYIERVNTRR